MAMYGSATSFLLIFNVKNDLVKVSCKSDAQKCQNPYFDQVSERCNRACQDGLEPFFHVCPFDRGGGVLSDLGNGHIDQTHFKKGAVLNQAMG